MPNDSTPYVTATQISLELGVHVQSVQKYFREDGLPGRKVGGEWKTTRAALDAWLISGNAPQPDVAPGLALPPLETK